MEERINTITSGIMLLSSSSFDIGDLIETNDTQGIASEITLSYTKIRDFLGIFTYIPNKAVYNASIKKFTQKISRLPGSKKEEEIEKKKYKKFIEKVEKIILKEEKFTRYIRVLEVPYIADLEHLGDLLEDVFDKYEKRLGIRPYYYANTTKRDHLSITLQILSRNPQLVLRHTYPFIKDVLYALFSDELMAKGGR
jgi:small-conductance mechanosensitive channel